MKKIIFTQKTKKDILDSLDKAIDGENYLVEKNNPSQRILDVTGEEIHVNKFAGIKKGSELFFQSDITSLIGLADLLEAENE